jgi:atypical dual specificity phosphatase
MSLHKYIGINMKRRRESEILPEYPRTHHLPHKANAKRDDLIASLDECKVIFSEITSVEEKVDGSACGMSMLDDQPLIRNRNHILNKAYSKVKNSSKAQFSSVWNWWYENRKAFNLLLESGPYSVYGEWMYMAHGMIYDNLPSMFIAYDIWDFEERHFIDPKKTREVLTFCGFAESPILHYCRVESFEQLEKLTKATSVFDSLKQREGCYLKVTDGKKVTARFKMVGEDFVQGKYLDRNKITRNNINGH